MSHIYSVTTQNTSIFEHSNEQTVANKNFNIIFMISFVSTAFLSAFALKINYKLKNHT